MTHHMARQAKPETAQNVKDLKAIVENQDAELVELRAIVARIDPEAMIKQLQSERKEYAKDIIDRAIALGAIGMSPEEIRVELGVSDDNWKAWMSRYPAFGAAVSRARSLAKAYWFRKGRVAMETHNWKFNMDKLPRIIETLFADVEQDLGDASQLIVLDAAANGTD